VFDLFTAAGRPSEPCYNGGQDIRDNM